MLSIRDSLALQRRYRLMWMDVPYEPGEVKVGSVVGRDAAYLNFNGSDK